MSFSNAHPQPYVPPPRLAQFTNTSGMQYGPPQRTMFNTVPEFQNEQEPKTTFEPFTIHSSDRDTSMYPNSNQYKIKLSDSCGPLKNVKSIELVGGSIPDQSAIAQQSYLLLCIDELSRGHIKSTNPTVQSAYALLQPDKALENGYFVQLKADWFRFSKVELPGTTINQLSIAIRQKDGTLFPFDSGTDHDLFFIVERYT